MSKGERERMRWCCKGSRLGRRLEVPRRAAHSSQETDTQRYQGSSMAWRAIKKNELSQPSLKRQGGVKWKDNGGDKR